MNCQRCQQSKATVHITDVPDKREQHLCDECAVKVGVIIKQSHQTANEILQQFIKPKTGLGAVEDLACPKCGLTFKEFKEENLRVAEENNQSPDLTHYRDEKKGDTLPLMCFRIYGDSRHYMEVARANKLANFRNLTVGEQVFFPPFEKSAGA